MKKPVEQKDQILGFFRQVTDLRKQMEEHWAMAQQAIETSRVDQAITLLNAYFRLKTSLERAETNLQGLLSGYFAGQ